MPTRRRRHAITETPQVQAVLDELRAELGDRRLDLREIVVLGAREKLARLRVERARRGTLRRLLAARVREGEVPVDVAAMDEVRRAGWART